MIYILNNNVEHVTKLHSAEKDEGEESEKKSKNK